MRQLTRATLLAMATLLVPAGAGANAQASDASSGFAPAVDHHQHLVSPAGAAELNMMAELDEPLAADLADMLQRRAAAWNDAAALTALYTADATALNVFDDEFLRGGSEVAAFFARMFVSGYHLHPVAARIEENRAFLYGYYLAASGDGIIGYLSLELERQADGDWLIAREDIIYPGPEEQDPILAADLVRRLDEAGIGRAVVLSVAYWFAEPQYPEDAETIARVEAENDWTIAQAAQFPDRLIAFCSINPLRDHALAEIERCAEAGGRGLKMHFGNSDVYLAEPGVTERVREVFAASNRRGLPMIVHTRDRDGFGARETQILLNELIPAAPDVTVQVAHLWGGSLYAPESLAAFVAAFAQAHPSTRNLYFDLTDAGINVGNSEAAKLEVVEAMRAIGLDRMLYGSDAAIGGHGDAASSWQALREGLPLTEAELRQIAGNVAPYLR